MSLHSVVIAAYNAASWIHFTLDDVLQQSDPQWELIVVDDGSSDTTATVVEDFIRSHPSRNIRLLRQANSGSPASPRNAGLAVATGEWISFLDHDDRWLPERLAKVRAVFEGDGSIAVVSHDQRILESGKVREIYHCGTDASDLYLHMLTRGNVVTTSATTLKASLVRELGGFDPRKSFFTTEDYDLWLRAARAGAKFYFLHETLGDYIVHAANMTGNIQRHLDAKNAVIQQHLADSPRLASYREEILGHLDYAAAREKHRRGEFRAARQLYAQAWKRGQPFMKPLLGYVLAGVGMKK